VAFPVVEIIETDRLEIDEWSKTLVDPTRKTGLEQALIVALTPKITRYLPLSMQFPGNYNSIADWISDRAAEARVLSIYVRDTGTFSGLILLHEDPASDENNKCHLGYFFTQDDWGKGYATEAVSAMVADLAAKAAIHLIAGVDGDNHASMRVLEKAGFKKSLAQSTKNRAIFEFVSNV